LSNIRFEKIEANHKSPKKTGWRLLFIEGQRSGGVFLLSSALKKHPIKAVGVQSLSSEGGLKLA